MGVAAIVLSALRAASNETSIALVGIGLFAIGLASLQNE